MSEEIADLGVKVSLNSLGFQSGIGQINSGLKVLSSGLKANTASLGTNGKGVDALKLKGVALAQSMDLQKKKVSDLEKTYNTNTATLGKDAKATQDSAISLNNAKAALSNMGTALDATNKQISIQSSGWTKLGAAFSGAGTKLKETGKSIGDVGGSLTKSLTVPLIAVGVGLGAMVTKASESAESIQHMSEVTGLSAERLQELQYVGAKVGVSLDTMTGSQKFLIKAMSAAQTGTKAQVQVFKTLGISVVDSTGHLRDSNVVFQEAITKLGQMKNPAERNAMALKLFGRSALELNPLIETSAGEISNLTDEAHKSGAVISNEGVAAMAKFNKSMDAMKLSISGAVGIAAAKLIPTFEKLLPVIQDKLVPAIAGIAQKIADLIQGFTNCSPFVQKLILGFLAFAICIGPVLAFVGALITNIGIIVGAFGALSTAIGAAGGMFAILTGPIGITIAVVVALAAVAFLVIKNWGAITAFFKNLWAGITTDVSNFGTGFKNFFVGLWNGVKTTTENVFKGIKTFFSTVWTDIKNVVMAIATPFVNGITNLFNSMKTGLTNIFNGLKSIVEGVWLAIKTVILGPVLLILDLVTGNFTKLSSDAQGIFNNLKSAFSGIWNGIKQVFTGVVQAISGFLTIEWNGMRNIATSIFNGISSFFTSALNGIKNTFVSVWNGVVSFFEGLPGRFASIASGIGSAIKGGFTSAISFITGLPGEAVKWGADIINGIVSGIKGAVGAIGTAVSGVAQSIRSFLHFSVPDKGPLKDFESWMPDFMGGLAKGIKNSKYLVSDAIKNMSTDVKVNANMVQNSGASAQEAAKSTTRNNNGDLTFAIENFVNNRSQDIESIMTEAAFYMKQKQLGGSK